MRRAKDAQLKANLASDEDSDSHVGTHTTGTTVALVISLLSHWTSSKCHSW